MGHFELAGAAAKAAPLRGESLTLTGGDAVAVAVDVVDADGDVSVAGPDVEARDRWASTWEKRS